MRIHERIKSVVISCLFLIVRLFLEVCLSDFRVKRWLRVNKKEEESGT